jgi:Xaa-Pro aminopeptidase
MIDSPVAFTHPVGMAVHDVGDYRDEPMRPGLVFALDPQLWVPDEQLYIRVEDTVAVTSDGVESLTADCPLDLDEVERWMAGPGMLDAFGPLVDGTSLTAR